MTKQQQPPKTVTIEHTNDHKIVELEGKYYGYKWDEDRKMLACLHAEGKTLEEVKELLA